MLDQVLAAVANWIIGSISDLGYFGLVILMAVESACVPLPSEIIMPFAGYLVFGGRFSLLGAATMGAIGCNLGSTLAYLIAAKGGRKAIERWGAYVLIRPAELAKAEQFFARYGSMAVFVSRLLPVIRTFIAFSRPGLRGCQCEISGLYVPRLVALVFFARLHWIFARGAVAQ